MAKKEKHPLKSLANFYEASVKEQDEKGFAEMYKQATELLFNSINDEVKSHNDWKYKLKNPKFTFEDIEYLDGYFIFGYGTNTVIHFHIKEIPGWKFAIWWDEPEDKSSTDEDQLSCSFFCQYESNIDKFKPSRSELCLSPAVMMKEEPYALCYQVADLLVFMVKEPELAFCRDYHGWNYNEEYHSRAEAKKEFNKYIAQRKKEIRIKNYAENKMINAVHDLFKFEFFADPATAYLLDRGDNWSPRYEVFINKDAIEEYKDDESGSYHFDDLFDEHALKKYNAKIKSMEKLASRNNTYWFNPVSNFVTLVDEKKFKKLQGENK